MKINKLSGKKLKKGVLCGVLLLILLLCVKKYREIVIYDNLNVSINDKVFEYGNTINLKKFFDKNKDYKYSIVKDLNTSRVGKQQVEVKVEYKGVARVIPLSVSVVDTIAPVIQIKEESITINEGEDINLLDNVGDVVDSDKKIEYKESAGVSSSDVGYYTVYANDFNSKVPGEYAILVVAVDEAGNKTESGFKVIVKEVVKAPVVVAAPPSYQSDVVNNAAPNLSSNDIVSIAYSLVGSPYVYGGNSPSGFDCSGFVQYVYSQVGKSVSRSSSTQAYDGVGVSYNEAQPGDILSWGHGGMVTHSAIYVGNGQMVHAMNTNTGVVISNVDGWSNADVLMSVRRVS